MRFARPPDGFRVLVPKELEDRILSHNAIWPGVEWCWCAIVVRLEMTAHRDGTEVGEGFVQVFPDMPLPGLRFRVAYLILGDCVHVADVWIGPLPTA